VTAPSATPALTARWTNLALLSYRAPEELLRRYLHPALELDRWDGHAHVSLVAFDFEDTRVLGLRIPGFVRFPEVNLRTYVRHGDRRGVVFIRELVPSPIVALVARVWYNEPYRAVPITGAVSRTSDAIVVRRAWRTAHREHRVELSASRTTRLPPESSVEHYFKEHAWGFGRTRSGRLLHYRVDHPPWAVHEVQALAADIGFAATYGRDWTFLDRASPVSVVLAEGSPISVHRATTPPDKHPVN
jgi:uncharacterized protein YqjF (DUF2071 family)